MNAVVAPGALAHFAGERDRALVAAGGQPRVHGAHQVRQGTARRCTSSRDSRPKEVSVEIGRSAPSTQLQVGVRG